jgi:hypothetical protein
MSTCYIFKSSLEKNRQLSLDLIKDAHHSNSIHKMKNKRLMTTSLFRVAWQAI